MKYLFLSVLIFVLMGKTAGYFFHTLERHRKQKRISDFKLINKFSQFSVYGHICQGFVAEVSANFVGWSQIYLGCNGWFAVNCFRILPAFIIFSAVACLGIGVGVTVFILWNGTEPRLMSIGVIEENRKRFWTVSRYSSKNYFRFRWNAQRPLPIYCGDYCPFSKGAIMTYLDVLTNNLATAIIVIKP